MLGVWLAGSYARGTNDRFSDVDLWVVVSATDVDDFCADWPATCDRIAETVFRRLSIEHDGVREIRSAVRPTRRSRANPGSASPVIHVQRKVDPVTEVDNHAQAAQKSLKANTARETQPVSGTGDDSQNTEKRGFDHIVARYNRPVLFYTLATLIPWILWFVAAYLSNLGAQTSTVRRLTMILSIAGLIAPVAVVVALIWNQAQLRADVWHRLAWPRNSNWIYIASAFLLLPASVLAATAVSLLFGYSAEQFHLRGGYTFSAGLLPVWVTLVGAAVLEELAWHSYGTDSLIRRMRVFSASIVFTVIWVFWHLPLSFIKDYYHNEVVKSGWLHTLNFPMSMLAFVFLMNWLYFCTGRSIVIPIVFHTSANFANEIFRTDPDTKIIQTGLLLILSVIVVLRDGRLFFRRPPR